MSSLAARTSYERVTEIKVLFTGQVVVSKITTDDRIDI